MQIQLNDVVCVMLTVLANLHQYQQQRSLKGLYYSIIWWYSEKQIQSQTYIYFLDTMIACITYILKYNNKTVSMNIPLSCIHIIISETMTMEI